MVDLNYLAGFFDGEGCVSINLTGTVCVSLDQKGEKGKKLFDLITCEYGGKVWFKDKKYTDIYSWRVNQKDQVINFLETIYPYSILKKEQVAIGISAAKLIRTNNLGCRPLSEKERHERLSLRNKLFELKTTKRSHKSLRKIESYRNNIKEVCGFRCVVCGDSLRDTSLFGQIISDGKLYCRSCNMKRHKPALKYIPKEKLIEVLESTQTKLEACKKLRISKGCLYKKIKTFGLIDKFLRN